MEREPEPGERRWSVYRPSKSQQAEGAPAPPVSVRRPVSVRQRSVHPVGVLIAVGGVLVALGVPVIFAVAGSDSGVASGGVFGSKSEVQVLTEDGVDDLVEALEEETGSAEAFSATIYPTYAVVRVPVDRTSQRETGYYWDGHDLEPWGSKGTSSYDRFDLADIDAAVLPPLVRTAKAQVDDPNSWYVIIDHDSSEGEGWISAYASNEFSEGGYVLADREGNVVRRVTWPTTEP